MTSYDRGMSGSMTSLQSYAHLQLVNDGYWVDEYGWLHNALDPQRVVIVPIPEATTQPRIDPRSAILHTNAGTAYTRWERLVAYWRRLDITGEAHQQLDLDGTIAQALPYTVRADCNAKANSWTAAGRRWGALSCETADLGGATIEDTPWSLAQLTALVGWLTAVCATYGIPCTDVPTWDGAGIAPHNRHREWTIYKGKTCPGAARTRQMDWIRAQVADRLAQFHARNGTSCPGS